MGAPLSTRQYHISAHQSALSHSVPGAELSTQAVASSNRVHAHSEQRLAVAAREGRPGCVRPELSGQGPGPTNSQPQWA